jgi:uncharacterized protein YraI
MPKRILRPLLAAAALLMSAACSSLTPPGESVAQVTFNGAPQINIISPQANARYREGANVYIVARVENAGPDISGMTVMIGDEIIASEKPDTGGSASFAVNARWPASRSGSQVISVSVKRADPSLSDIKTVDIEVIGVPTPTVAPTQVTPTVDTAPQTDISSPGLNVPQPTTETGAPQAAPTQAPPTEQPATPVPPTSSAPQVKVKAGANVRKGPSTAFEPPLGSMAAGQTAEIIGKNLDGSWYKIRFYNGEGWIAAITVDVEGSTSSLVAEAGPPTPIPATPVPVVPTGIPATGVPAAPSTGPDLVVEGTPAISPHPFVCNQASEITITVKNIGNGASNISKLVVQDMFNGAPGATTSYPLGVLQPGQTAQAVVYLTVATNYNQAHTTRVTVDAEAQNTETNEGNNQYNSAVYNLEQGACP